MNTVHREMEDAGWRGKVGWITPPGGSLDPFEFLQIAPPGLRVIPTMTYVPGFADASNEDKAKNIVSAAAQIEECSVVLKGAGVDVIAQSGGPFAYLGGGLAGGRAVQARIQDKVGLPLVMMGLAMLNAANEFGYTRAAVAATYYNDTYRDGFKRFLEDGGVEVAGIENWVQQGIFRSQEDVNRSTQPLHTKLTLGMSYKAAVTAARKCPDADCLIVCGGAIPIISIIEALEEDLGIPVITGVGALFWETFKTLGIGAPIHGYGSVLASLERRLRLC